MHNAGRLRACIALLVSAMFVVPAAASESAHSDIRDDETLQFFRTSAWLDEPAQVWHVPIHGWIYEPEDSVARKAVFETVLENEYGLEVSAANEANFTRRLNLLIADNERGKTIVIRIAGRDYALPSSDVNGQFRTVLQLAVEAAEEHAPDDTLTFEAVMPVDDQRRFQGEARLVPPQGVSVISDIDDTIKITEVTDRRNLLRNTFLLDFAAVPGMSELYRDWAQQDVSFHFVSSSPWQLYAPLQAFADDSGFPWSAFSLKPVRFRDETLLNLFKKGTETKPAIIESILAAYPQRQFVLVGDSGEQDPEVYADLLRKFPDRIRAAYIRNVTQESADNSRFAEVFHGIDDRRWQLFDDPASLPLPPPASSPAMALEGNYLYRVTAIRAAAGSLAQLLDWFAAVRDAGFYDTASRHAPMLMRHSQGDHWDLLVITPLGSWSEHHSAAATAARRDAASKHAELLATGDSLVAFEEDHFAYGPPLVTVRSAYRDNGFYHIEMFRAAPGKATELIEQRRMENDYLGATGQTRNTIFRRAAGSDIDVFTIGFHKSLEAFAAPAPLDDAQKEAAARAAGFEDRAHISFYLRSLISGHHDTLAVKVR